MFSALMEIAISVWQDVEWELIAPRTACFVFASPEQAEQFAGLARLLPTTEIALLGSEVVITWQ